MPGAPSEQANRWVVGRNEAEARAEAEKKCASDSILSHCSIYHKAIGGGGHRKPNRTGALMPCLFRCCCVVTL